MKKLEENLKGAMLGQIDFEVDSNVGSVQVFIIFGMYEGVLLFYRPTMAGVSCLARLS